MVSALSCAFVSKAAAQDSPAAVRRQADAWRAEHRLIDMHLHIDYTEEHLARAVRIMEAAGLGIGVNLSGGTVTQKDGAPSSFERNTKQPPPASSWTSNWAAQPKVSIGTAASSRR